MDKGDYYETGLTSQFHEILKDKPKGLVVDVGMNIGWFTLLSRAMGQNVVGFDPNPIMHSRVCESLHLNKWMEDGSVILYSYGLGNEEATLNLTTGKNPGGSSFDATRLAKKFRRQISVPVTTLDTVALQLNWIVANKRRLPIHLLKVDVEGHELFVFQGARQLLQSNAIENIIMESSAKDLRVVSDLLSLIFHAGYKVQLLSTVNGDPYHPEMVKPLNEVLSLSSIGMDLSAVGEEVKFLAKIDACNIWWVRSPIQHKQ
jgi:FkbM family methyltransferase